MFLFWFFLNFSSEFRDLAVNRKVEFYLRLWYTSIFDAIFCKLVGKKSFKKSRVFYSLAPELYFGNLGLFRHFRYF